MIIFVGFERLTIQITFQMLNFLVIRELHVSYLFIFFTIFLIALQSGLSEGSSCRHWSIKSFRGAETGSFTTGLNGGVVPALTFSIISIKQRINKKKYTVIFSKKYSEFNDVPVMCTQKWIHPGFETQGRCHQKSKTGISVVTRKGLKSFKIFKKKMC